MSFNNYYYDNRERILSQRADYYKQNKEMINERSKHYFKKYYQKHKKQMILRAKDYLIKWKNEDYENYRVKQNLYQKNHKLKKKPKRKPRPSYYFFYINKKSIFEEPKYKPKPKLKSTIKKTPIDFIIEIN